MLALATTPAQAEQRGHLTTPREFGSGQLKNPDGVAVNEATGVVYVADSGDNRVALFDGASGALLGEINGGGKLAARGELEAEGVAAGGGGQPDEEPTGEFSDPTLVAVNNSCKDQKLTGTACEKADPSNGDVYVLDYGHRVVDKYTATGGYVGQINAGTLGVEEHVILKGVAVESDGDLLVSTEPVVEALRTTEEGVFRLSDGVDNVVLPRSGVPAVGFTGTAQWGFALPGLGVAGGRVFVPQGPAEKYVAVWGLDGKLLAGGDVNEVVVPPLYEEHAAEFIGGLGGESCTGDVYVDTGFVIDRFVGSHVEGSGGPVESLPVPVGAVPGEHVGFGVAPDCVSLGLFAVDSVAGVVDVYERTPPQSPEIVVGGGSASEVSDDGAKLSMEVNPRSEPGEHETVYTFEYGPCPGEGSCVGVEYGHSVGGGVPAQYGRVGVSVTLRGLSAGTRYHYRLRAHNAQEHEKEVFGEDGVFVTQSSFVGGLLDGRGWELVSPADKQGAEIEPVLETGVIQAAADGGGIAYVASAPTETDPAGNTNKTQVLSRRTEDGWSSRDIGLPNAQATGPSVGQGQEYRAFSSDLEYGLAWPLGVVMPGLAPGAREVSPLLVGLSGSSSTYQALLSGCPEEGEPCESVVREHADVQPGIEVAQERLCPPTGTQPFCAAEPQGANQSLSAVVIRSKSPLVAKAPREALYEWDGGHVYPVSVSPTGTIIGTETRQPVLGTRVGTQAKESSSRGAVSADGSRVVWSEEEVAGGHLFLWDRELERSIQVDVAQAGASGSGRVEPAFQYMTPDGSRVFFTDTQRLTADAGAESTKPDLYECEVVVEEVSAKCVVKDLTPPVGGAGGEVANVVGQAIGGSETGGIVYFVANGELTKEPSASGEHPVTGDCGAKSTAGATCNLYAWSEGAAEPVLIAVISGEDVGDWGGGAKQLTSLTARAAGSGEWLVFMSNRSLTGYDNRDIQSGALDEEVYEYHYGQGVVCVSCNPTGERPHGYEYEKLNEGLAAGVTVWPHGAWLSGFVPGWTPFSLDLSSYQSRYLEDSGRVFFDSTDGLVPHDTNRTVNVYEFEPPGVGSCTTASPGYVPREDGCLGLVSSGESGEESGFLDASENGNDVFFITKAQLSKRDTDTSLDIYDARVGGEEPEESKPVECQGDACQSPVTPPEALTPSSLTSNGVGNLLSPPAPGPAPKAVVKKKPETRQQKLQKALKQCRRDRGKARKKACERRARRKFRR